MVRSMTGYGRGEHTDGDRKFIVEIKSVNHRYNDMTVKLPRGLNPLEDKIRKELAQWISRGKTDVYITFEDYSGGDALVRVNEDLAQGYYGALQKLKEKFHIDSEDELTLLGRFPEVITVEKGEEDEQTLYEALLPALREAAEKFSAMRQREGEALRADIEKKCGGLAEMVEKINERSPFVVEEYQQKLQARLEELLKGIEIDPQRIATEAAVFADRSCVDEEITRLESHIGQMYEIFAAGGLVGRKLDFLVQEMNRETNTIASKANDLAITKLTIDMKSEIEKIREQIQNIE